MRSRWLPWLPLLAVLALFAGPAPAPAQAKPETPTFVLRVRSLDTLFTSGQLLLEAVGKGQVLKQLDDIIKSKVGPKGLVGVDRRRPLGLYANVGKDITDLKAVLLVPISDEKAFLELLDGLNFKTENKDGLYTVKQNVLPLDIHFRFAHKYAYITALNPEAIDPGTLIAPAKLFSAKQTAALSLRLRVDQVPDMAKQILLQHLNDGLDKVLEVKEKNSGPAQNAFREQLVKEIGRQLTSAIRDGLVLNADIDVDAKSSVFTADVRMTAKPGSLLATTIDKLGQGKSLFAGLLRDDAAMNLLVHHELPDKLRSALGGLISEAAKKSLAETSDEAKKKQILQVIAALEPTFKAGQLDLAISLRGPGAGDRYTLVGGVKLKDGDKVAATLRELLKDLPEAERKNIKLDVEKAGGATIHELNLSRGFDAKAREMFGEGPMYIAFRPDAAFFAMGEDSRKAIKEALTAPTPASAPLRLDLSLSRLAVVMAKTPEQVKAARRLLTQNEEGRFRISLEGGQQLRLRVHVNLTVIRLLSQLGALEAEKKK
jgi:hypothetical protein